MRGLVVPGVDGVRRHRGWFQLDSLAAQGEATPGRLGILLLYTQDVVCRRAAAGQGLQSLVDQVRC